MNAERLAAAERLRCAYETELGDTGAFLPARVPLDRLPPPWQPFLDAADELARHYPEGRGGVRGWLDDRFGDVDPGRVARVPALSEPEQQRLMTVLSVLAHVYRWDSVPPAPERFAERSIHLPAGIREPWWRLAELHGQPAVGTTWSMLLGNWRMTDRPGGSAYRPDELTPRNLRVAHQWLPSPHDEYLQRFSLTFVLMEAAGAGALRALVEVVEACARGDRDAVLPAMRDLHAGIRAVATSFTANVRAAHIDPEVWLELVQPTFAWAADTPDGSGEGASGMQLGTIQSLDAALGVAGDSHLAGETLRARRYLPPAHRRFLGVVDDVGRLVPDHVAATGDADLTHVFNACLKALGTFRVAHVTRGARYLTAGRDGGSPRVSTGMGTSFRPDRPATTGPPDGGSTDDGTDDHGTDDHGTDDHGTDDEDPVDVFRRSMTERIHETRAAALDDGPAGRRTGAAPGRAGRSHVARTPVTPI